MTRLALTNGVTESTAYDSRLRMSSIEAKTADQTKLLGLNYTYYNNSNVQTQQITGLGVTANQSYGYDGVNRLASASEDSSVWSRGFGYDLRGNGWVTSWTGIQPDNFTPRSASWFDAKNRLVNVGLNVGYDAAGNQTSIGAYGFGYDGENRLTQSTVNAASVTYAYDGEGRRVKRTAGGQTTVYVYRATGELAAEYGGETNGGGTQYLTVDALGSTRLVTKADAGVVCRTDYLPYGEEIAAGTGGRSALWGGCSGIRQKFTGKERGDAGSENSLDYFGARYYSGAQGRFTTPDPLRMTWERLEDPQQLNLYSYVRNNPLGYTDPNGEELRAVTYKLNSGLYGIGYLDTEVVPAFQSFDSDLVDQGYDATYTYLFRTTDEQTAIYLNPAAAGGNPVAIPGTSAHESGLAFDINRAGLGSQGLPLSDLRDAATEHGFSNLGVKRGRPIDPPHFQYLPFRPFGRIAISRFNAAYLARIKENQRSHALFQRVALANNISLLPSRDRRDVSARASYLNLQHWLWLVLLDRIPQEVVTTTITFK